MSQVFYRLSMRSRQASTSFGEFGLGEENKTFATHSQDGDREGAQSLCRVLSPRQDLSSTLHLFPPPSALTLSQTRRRSFTK